MRSLRLHAYGNLDRLSIDEAADPVAGPTDVIVRVHAASINPLDQKLVSGLMSVPFPLNLPYPLGTDFAGTVMSVGPVAGRWKIGDRVFGRSAVLKGGALSEYITVSGALIATVPENVSFAEAAAYPTIAGTAWQAIFEEANLLSGQTLLVHGSTRGVGSIAVQLAKMTGAQVIATVSNVTSASTMAADSLIDYQTADLSSLKQTVDVVLDAVGGPASSELLEVLRPGGVIVGIVTPPDTEKTSALNVRALRMVHANSAGRLSLIAHLVSNGSLKAVIDPLSFNFDRSTEAFAHLQSGNARGKVLVTSD